MHKPSLPEDLDRPERLWARAVTMALVDTACSDHTEFALDDDGVWCHTTGAGGWWRLTLVGEGRAVFCGQDPDGSHTHVGGEQIDFLAGGPEWLPWELLRDDAKGNLLGFVYWWEDGAWHRIAYPAELREDGLDGAAPWAGSEEKFATRTAEWHDLRCEAEELLEAALVRFLALAEARTVDADAVAELLAPAHVEDRPAPRLDVALDFAARAGIMAGQPEQGP